MHRGSDVYPLDAAEGARSLAPSRRVPSVTGIAFAAAMVVSSWVTQAAQAQSISLELSAPGDPGLLVPSAEIVGASRLKASLTLAESRRPYSVISPLLERDSVVLQRTELTLGVGYAYEHRWLIAATVPMVLAQSGSAVTQAQSLGDASLRARALLFGTQHRELALSVDGILWAPTGSAEAYASDESVRAGVSAIVSGRHPRYGWSFEAGVHGRGEQVVEAVVPYRVGHELLVGAAAQVPVDYRARLFVGCEVRA
jgi:hypothetical protein